MAFLTEIAAKAPEIETPGEMELPSVESAPAFREAPGLLGWMSRPDIALRLVLAALLLGAAVIFLSPAAFPRRVGRQPPLLPPRAPALRPPRLPPTPLPDWMLAPPSVSVPATRVLPAPSGSARPTVEGNRVERTTRPGDQRPGLLAPSSPPPALGVVRLQEPDGVLCMISREGVTVDHRRVPEEWARAARRLFAAPSPQPPADLSPLRLLAPDPTDAAFVSPPVQIRWSSVPGVTRFLLTLEVLTNPVEHVWNPVGNLFSTEVTGTEYALPGEIQWAPGALYRCRVETPDGRFRAAGSFRVLSDRQRRQYQEAREAVGNSQLMRAVVYRAFGFYGPALAELRGLQSAQPEERALWRAIQNLQADIQRRQAAASD